VDREVSEGLKRYLLKNIIIYLMAIVFDTYRFEGPFLTKRELKQAPGVFILLCTTGKGTTYIVDAGESENVRQAIEDSPNRHCWVSNCKGTISVAVLYTPELDRKGRKEIERIIRSRDFVPCQQY